MDTATPSPTWRTRVPKTGSHFLSRNRKYFRSKYLPGPALVRSSMADEPDTPDTDEKVGESTAADVEDRDDLGDAAEAVGTDEVDEIDEEESRSKNGLASWRHWASRRRLSRVGSALVTSAVIVAMLSGLAGW